MSAVCRHPTEGCRDGYRLECPVCEKPFKGYDLADIARKGATHWNREHGDKLKRRYDPIDEVVFGGHHLHDHSYEVRKYKVYLTAFDVMERIGLEDGRLVNAKDDCTCKECCCYIPNPQDRLEENPESSFKSDFVCMTCAEKQEIQRRTQENQQITEWSA